MRKLTLDERRKRRFTELFKKEQVALIDRGETTVSEIARLYQVKNQNVWNWVRKYSKSAVAEPLIVGSRNDYDHLRVVERENKSLKQFIGEQQIRIVYLEELLSLAKERLGNDFEKKW